MATSRDPRKADAVTTRPLSASRIARSQSERRGPRRRASISVKEALPSAGEETRRRLDAGAAARLGAGAVDGVGDGDGAAQVLAGAGLACRGAGDEQRAEDRQGRECETGHRETSSSRRKTAIHLVRLQAYGMPGPRDPPQLLYQSARKRVAVAAVGGIGGGRCRGHRDEGQALHRHDPHVRAGGAPARRPRPSARRARQSAPSAQTCPSGSRRLRTSARMPIISS